MNRRATKTAPVVPPSAKRRQRSAGAIRSPQQIMEPRPHTTSPEGLVPGIVRRASVTDFTMPVESLENVLAPDDSQPQVSTPNRMEATEFCRQARRLRAVHENDPVRMHQQLSQLSVNTAGDLEPIVAEVDSARLDPRLRPARAISWTWTQTARLGKNGVSLLSKLGRGFSMGADEPSSADYAMEMDDDHQQYRLEDPDEAATPDNGFPTSVDRTFAALITRTLQSQHRSPLRYSQRLDLLKEAGRRGIGRFEANLIIASVQHKLGLSTVLAPTRRPLRLPGLLAFLLVQSIIVWGLWRVLRT